ncbi:MAG: hypothetical protein PHG06_00220 [Parabacteroides sp.]|nr:hypothetical protein [Parabacteroides sp.]
MSEFEDVINRLGARYKDIVLDPSGKSATKVITTHQDMTLYENKDPADWEVTDEKTKVITLVKDVQGASKLIILEFLGFFNDVKKEIQEKAPIENLKAGGFKFQKGQQDTPCEAVQADVVDNVDEKNRLAREANERKLAMADEAEAAEDTRNEQKKAVNSKSSINPSVPETHDMFEDRPVEYVEPHSWSNESFSFFTLVHGRD